MEPIDRADQVVPAKPESWHRFEIGPELFWYAYEEPGLMDMEGWLYGVDARLSFYHPRVRQIEQPGDTADDQPPMMRVRREQFIFVLHGRYAQGKTDYDGALLDEARTPYTISSIDATTYEVRLLAGYAPFMTDTAYTAFFLGFGYRYKDDDSSFDPAGYKRESTYRYLPVALRHYRQTAGGQHWAFSLEYAHLMSGEQISDLRPFDGPRLRKKQNDGFGLRAAAALSGATGRFDWTLEPFVRYWDIDDSELVFVRTPGGVAVFLEPENTTWEVGLSARFVF